MDNELYRIPNEDTQYVQIQPNLQQQFLQNSIIVFTFARIPGINIRKGWEKYDHWIDLDCV